MKLKQLLPASLSLALTLAVVSPLMGQRRATSSRTALMPVRQFVFTASADNSARVKLKADMAQLLRDAKAGKFSPRSQQLPPGKSNHLSTTVKIVIIAGIAIAILAVIVVHDLKHLDCNSRCVL